MRRIAVKITRQLIRWAWLKLTGEDPVVVSRLLTDCERLNSVHVKFLEQLEHQYPNLKPEIKAHQKQRFDAINPTSKDKPKLS